MGDKCEQSQNSSRAADTTSQRTSTVATTTPATVALLYLRAEQVIEVLPVSRRTLSNWQARRLIKFYRVGRTILFKRSDIEIALEKFAVNPIGEAKPTRHRHVQTGTITTEPNLQRKRRMMRNTLETAT
jgi:excisionase family DNA binding protein